MGRKRKLDPSNTTAMDSAEPPQKQLQQEQPPAEENPLQQEDPQNEQPEQNDAEEEGEGEEYEEVEEEEEEEEEEQDGEEQEEENNDNLEQNGDGDDNPNPNQVETKTDSAAVVEAGVQGVEDEDDDDDDDPVEKLLEPFSKDQLIALLKEVAESHSDVAERIRKVADEDPAHRKIFVHGLGWETTAEILSNEFKVYGEIEDVKNVTDKVSGKCKGYAFILFKTRKGARAALKQPQKKINNRTASCQLATVGPVSAAAPSAAPQGPQESEYTRKKIYVSNVGADLDPQKLFSFFSKFGEIEEGPLGLDKMTGKPKGFCLFVYRTVESAKKALEEPHKNFEGHILHCQKAIDGPKLGKGKFPQQQQTQHNTHFQKKKNAGYSGGHAQGHLMAPSGPGLGFNQRAPAPQAMNPALGQALTALLSNPAAGLGLTNLLGTLGSAVGVNPGVPGTAPPMQGGYVSQGMHGGYGNQQMGQGGAGRGQHGAGQYGGVPPNMGL